MKPLIVILLIMTAGVQQLKGQVFNVMFYNVENLFDTVDDTTRDDDEFLPSAGRHWTEERYRKKINSISRVIAAAGEWDLPAVVGLCEVENAHVVSDISRSPVLAGAGYGFVHMESPDPRGIDLAMLYRRDVVRIAEVRSWLPETDGREVFETRNILYAKVVACNDTLHIMLCHFPSRRGGVLASEHIRKELAMLVKAKADSILSASGNRSSLMVMGDFNADHDEEVMKVIADGSRLINTSVTLSARGKGSYRYQGQWEMIDQIIVSQSMAGDNGSFHADPASFRVFDAAFLLTDDHDYPGSKPLAGYSGYRWTDGYSDHLPVLVTVECK